MDEFWKMAEEYCSNEVPFDTTECGEKLYTESDLKYAYLTALRVGSQLDKVYHEDANEGKWVKREDSKTKWHRVADGELPSTLSTVLDEDGNKVEYIGCGKWVAYSDYYEEYVEVDSPIAWCEVPTFNEELSE